MHLIDTSKLLLGSFLRILLWCMWLTSLRCFLQASKILPKEVTKKHPWSIFHILPKCFQVTSMSCFQVASTILHFADASRLHPGYFGVASYMLPICFDEVWSGVQLNHIDASGSGFYDNLWLWIVEDNNWKEDW
jgi:hypothetical protein